MTETPTLIRYDAARQALAEACSVDEVKDVRDKADALRLYARQANDTELETLAAEIKLRAQRRIGELSRELPVSKGGKNPSSTLPRAGKSKRAALTEAGLSTSAANRCEAIAAIPAADFEAYIEAKKAAGEPVHAGEAVKSIRNARKRQAAEDERGSHRTDTVADLAALAAQAANGGQQFAVVYADPAWPFESWSLKGTGRSAEMHYATMSLADIEALGVHVRALAAKNSVLLLWVVMPLLPQALAVIEAWGFTYKTCGISWVKTKKAGVGFHRGMGKWTQANAELCLLATRGAPYRLAEDVEQLLIAPVGKHSEKPDEARARIERLVGGPYLELFGRKSVPGWTVWGNEVGVAEDAGLVAKVS